MKLIETIQIPKYRIRINTDEVEQLRSAASVHYDAQIRSMAEPGGMIYGMINSLEQDQLEWDAWNSDVQLLVKALEGSAHHKLRAELRLLIARGR